MRQPRHVGSWLDRPADAASAELQARVSRARVAADGDRLGVLLLWLGRVLAPLGQEERASEALDEALQWARMARDTQLLAQVQLAAAWNDVDYGHHARALARCRSVSDEARKNGDALALRQAGFISATSLVHIGEHDLAVEQFEQARAALLARPGRSDSPARRHRHGRYLAGLAQAWLMRGGLLLEAGGRDAAGEALAKARTFSEEACSELHGAVPRWIAPALFTLQRVLLEAGEAEAARSWTERFREALDGAPRPQLADVLLTLGDAMVGLRLKDVSAGEILGRLELIQGARHPRVVTGELKLALLRCQFEAWEQLGDFRQALTCQQDWAEAKGRLRARLAREHSEWLDQTVSTWRQEADQVVRQAFVGPLRQAIELCDAELARGSTREVIWGNLSRARHSMSRALGIAEQYLGVMRAERLRREDLMPVDLSSLAEDVCDQMSPPDDAMVKLVRKIRPKVHVHGDESLLMRALTNLLSNAFKHAPPATDVTVELDARLDVARLSVSDQGPGLSLEMRARLFQRFATGAVRKGNGLGLAMVARAVRVHGARIVVDSEPGEGTKVTLLMRGASIAG